VTVVFLHPIGLDGGCWQFLKSEQLRTALRYDMLWHGARERPRTPLTLESFGRDVIDHVQGELDLVGLSLGGAVALRIALQWPDRVRSLMLACSSAGSASASRVLRERATEVETVGMAGVLDETLRRWFTREALGAGDHPGISYARKRLLADPPESFAGSWRALAENNVLAELPTLRARTTVLHAAEDVTGPLETKTEMVGRIPDSRLVVIPGPHMVQLENPATFEAAVSEHLSWAGNR
jgi:pimeloyl-ACP methyl ester carboxylesterase